MFNLIPLISHDPNDGGGGGVCAIHVHANDAPHNYSIAAPYKRGQDERKQWVAGHRPLAAAHSIAARNNLVRQG